MSLGPTILCTKTTWTFWERWSFKQTDGQGWGQGGEDTGRISSSLGTPGFLSERDIGEHAVL